MVVKIERKTPDESGHRIQFIPLVYDLTIGSKYIFLFDDAGNIMESIDRNQVESVTIHVL